MREIVWRIGDDSMPREPLPADPAAARHRLEQGNADFAALFGLDEASGPQMVQLAPEELGLSPTGKPPEQRPFATAVSCADARVPLELLLGQRANDLFVVRVAGGVLSETALGSLDFAVAQLVTVQLSLALGHTGCGAVSAAVDVYLDPPSYLGLGNSRPLLALLQNLLGTVRLAAHALETVHGPEVAHRPGYRDALIDLTVVANAGTVAASIAARIAQQVIPSERRIDAAYGVYDLLSRQVGLPGVTSEWAPGLVPAPTSGESFSHTLNEIAFGARVSRVLDESPSETR
jgi:carbonic anhydrase